MNRFALTTVIVSLACVMSVAGDNDPKTSRVTAQRAREKAEILMREWRTVTAELLREPTNAEAIQRLRLEAKAPHRDDARVPLLRMGDSEMITQCLTELRTKKSARRNAARQLKLSGNPAIIVLVAEDLFREESTEAEWVTPEFLERPVSVHAGEIIQAIIAGNSEFNAPVKAWVASLSQQPSSHRDAVRAEMRKWWLENRDLIRAGNYQQVKPPKK